MFKSSALGQLKKAVKSALAKLNNYCLIVHEMY